MFRGSSKLEDSTYLKHFKDETLMLLSSTDYWQDAKFEDTEDLTGEDDNIVNPYQYSAAQVSYQIDCNSQFMWTQFEIPWEQLPSYMINACESGKRDNQIINFIIHTVVNKMREIKTVIPSSAIKIIANKLIDKYPGVFRDIDEDGVVIGDGTYSIFRKIQDRNNYLNRPNKRKSVNENKKPVLNKQKHVAASSSFNINDESLENRIIETFGEQRSFLNRNPTIEEIQKVWPILLKEKAALIHFQQLTKSNLYTLEYTVKEKLPKFLKLLPNYTSRYENPEELLQVLEILTIYFKENLDCIFLELQNAELSEQFPLHPIIVRIGSEYHLYFQRVRIQETLQTLSKCFRLMMSYFFNFNLRYPKEVSLTLELFQRYFLKIHPDSGKQQKMKSCKRVINLMNKLKNL